MLHGLEIELKTNISLLKNISFVNISRKRVSLWSFWGLISTSDV